MRIVIADPGTAEPQLGIQPPFPAGNDPTKPVPCEVGGIWSSGRSMVKYFWRSNHLCVPPLAAP